MKDGKLLFSQARAARTASGKALPALLITLPPATATVGAAPNARRTRA